MSRATMAVNRFVAFLVALVLIVGGVASAVWGTDRVSPLRGAVSLTAVTRATDKSWWPWTVGIAGGLLIIVGLRWLLSHLPRRGTGPLKLAGSGRRGRLVADGGSAASMAAEVFARTPGVRSSRGTLLRERGQYIARLNATIEPEADLVQIAGSADQVSAQLAHVLGRDDLHCLVQLRLAKRARPRSRVQ